MIIQADVCVCDECGHRWLPVGSIPKRCASCKSSKWNLGHPGSGETVEVIDTPTSFNDPVRAERKQARRERKDALAASVKDALPPKPPESVRQETRRAYCPRHSPKFCESNCPHRVNVG